MKIQQLCQAPVILNRKDTHKLNQIAESEAFLRMKQFQNSTYKLQKFTFAVCKQC